MLYKATEEISGYFTMTDIKHEVRETKDGKFSAVEAGFNGKNTHHVFVNFISTDDGSDFAMRVFSFCTVPEDREEAAIRCVNDLNNKFRFLRFVYLPEERRIDVAYDMLQELGTERVGPMARELFLRTIQILDTAYPVLMKALWGD